MDLFFECHSGVSGDMTLGALVDLGADPDRIAEGLAALPVSGFALRAEAVKKKGVMATKVHVDVDEAKDVHRTWPEVRRIVTAARLPARAEGRALSAFEKLATAEAKVHGVAIDKIHFHEVGCVDAIVDVAGSMLALEQLDVERVVCGPINVGRGTVRCRHGVMPVPTPATAELLAGVPCYQDELEGELVTPTGAAIVTTLAEAFGPLPAFTVDRVGYGAGSREHADRPNVLRVSAGRLAEASAAAPPLGGLIHRRLRMLTCELDDESGETFTALFDRLFDAGALDVNLTPIHMKKNRPGVRLQVLLEEIKTREIVEIVLKETSTFGVKLVAADRYCLPRRMETIETRLGPVEVKVGEWEGHPPKAKPEFESCRRLAEKTGASLREVYLAAYERLSDALDRPSGP